MDFVISVFSIIVPSNFFCFVLTEKSLHIILMFVGNKAKGWISKRVFQESKACQKFRKTNIAYLLIRTRTCAYQGVINVCFSEILACFAFLKHTFWDSHFCLITDVLSDSVFQTVLINERIHSNWWFLDTVWEFVPVNLCENLFQKII